MDFQLPRLITGSYPDNLSFEWEQMVSNWGFLGYPIFWAQIAGKQMSVAIVIITTNPGLLKNGVYPETGMFMQGNFPLKLTRDNGNPSTYICL